MVRLEWCGDVESLGGVSEAGSEKQVGWGQALGGRTEDVEQNRQR